MQVMERAKLSRLGGREVWAGFDALHEGGRVRVVVQQANGLGDDRRLPMRTRRQASAGPAAVAQAYGGT